MNSGAGLQDVSVAGSADAPLRVFLSYSRIDRPTVEVLAIALEQAGLSVWWDGHLEGGSAFAEEIERALNKADAVVVAWSAGSLRSHWVLDEAAAGRDSDRLVPIRLDNVMPPLGFRQLQAVDFSKWNRTAHAPELNALVRGIQAAARPQTIAREQARIVPPGTPSRFATKHLRLLLAMLLLLGIAAAGWLVFGREAAARPETIAVLPFDDLSAGRDQAYFAQGVAEEILNALARDRRLKVLGRFTAAALRERSGDLGYLRNTLGVTAILEGSIRSSGKRLRIDVRLINTKNGAETWSERYDRASGEIFAIQDEIARSVARRLAGNDTSVQAAANTHRHTSPELYEQFLTARGLLRTRERARIEQANAVLERIRQADPDYTPALAQLAISDALLHYTNFGTRSTEAVGAAVRPILARLAQLDPALADAELARGQWLALQSLDAIPSLERAAALDPQSADALQVLAITRTFDVRPGSIANAVAEARRAQSIDPLWFRPVWALADAYGAAGRINDIRPAVERYAAIAPNRLDALKLDAHAAYAASDAVWLVRAVARARAAGSGPFQRGPERHAAEGWLYAPDLIARDSVEAAKLPEYLRAWFLDQPEPFAAHVASGATTMWDDYNVGAVSSWALLATGRAAQLTRLYHDRFPDTAAYAALGGKWYRTTGNLAWSLRAAGSARDAAEMTALLGQQLEMRRAAGKADDPVVSALYQVLSANPAKAAAIMEAGSTTGARLACLGPVWPGTLPWYADLKSELRAGAALTACRKYIARSRSEVGLPALPAEKF